MASNGEEVRKAALAELARRELARREQQKKPRSLNPFSADQLEQAKKDFRPLGLGARAVAEGAMDIVSPFADVASLGLNAVLPGKPFPERHSEALTQNLTEMGVPAPQGTAEKVANIASRMVTGAFAGGPINKAITSGMGFAAPTLTSPRPVATRTATVPAAQTLERAGVPLDASQRHGGRFAQMLRSAVINHPITSGRQAAFSLAQQKAFNRAVLRSIGVEAEEATQEVMLRAKQGIQRVFNSVGKTGATFDDVLQTEISDIVDQASRTVVASELTPLTRNVDDILAAVDDAGKISGEQLIKIRSNLSELRTAPGGLGQRAADLEEALLEALGRSHPGQRNLLQAAIDKYRNLKIIEPAIAKGADANIMPLQLSNAIGSVRNRAMSIFGQGGDQELVELAKAGRSVIPQVLPDSGTIPRGLMNAPIRALATAPLYKIAQSRLLAQPNVMPPGYGVRAASIPAGNAFLAEILRQQGQQ